MLEMLTAPFEVIARYFDKPWYLVLMLLLPLLWVFSFHSLSGLGRTRRILALTLRTLVFMCVIFGLAEAQWRQVSERLTVMYLLDQSQSIPASQRQSMMNYVIREVAKHRDNDRRDRAGVIVFGRDATIEIPPFDADLPSIGAPPRFVPKLHAAVPCSAGRSLPRRRCAKARRS